MEERKMIFALSKKFVAKSEEENTGWSYSKQIWQKLLKNAVARKSLIYLSVMLVMINLVHSFVAQQLG
jgi:hypothetical protein